MKSVRPIAIADHLWDAFDRMAEEMGSDREALVNQAMHVFARLNGFLVTGTPSPAVAPGAPVPPLPPERANVANRVLETAARLEQEIEERPAAGGGARLVLVREDGTEQVVAKDRFVIGRGPQCDLVVDSAKVSREHAVIGRDETGWFIEDLGSSNGTWHRRERIGRRRIEDGDEYFICSERIRCTLR